jgi:hypothetical protein
VAAAGCCVQQHDKQLQGCTFYRTYIMMSPSQEHIWFCCKNKQTNKQTNQNFAKTSNSNDPTAASSKLAWLTCMKIKSSHKAK